LKWHERLEPESGSPQRRRGRRGSAEEKLILINICIVIEIED
jgi:hypothetical protein